MNRNAQQAKPATTPTPPPTPPAKTDDPAVVEKITSVFWQQTTLAGLNEMMALAKTKGYGSHKDVMAAYDELKTKLN